MMQQNY